MQAALKLFSLLMPDVKQLPKAILYLILLPIAFISLFFTSPSVVVETIPLASPSQVKWYIEAAESIKDKYEKEVDWQELLAIDAVRFEQDFSKGSSEKAVDLAEQFIWEEKIVHKDTYIDAEGNKQTDKWTEIVYHKYSLSEVLENLGFNKMQKEKVKVFLKTDLTMLCDVGDEMPDGWTPTERLFKWPVPSVFRITSKFGPRIDPIEFLDGFHTGLDIGGGKGTNVVSAQDGVVVRAGWSGNYGKAVFIRHENYITRYCHLSRISVKEGCEVKKGEIIGKIGSTGKSTGPHLHFEIRKGNTPLDPLAFFM